MADSGRMRGEGRSVVGKVVRVLTSVEGKERPVLLSGSGRGGGGGGGGMYRGG